MASTTLKCPHCMQPLISFEHDPETMPIFAGRFEKQGQKHIETTSDAIKILKKRYRNGKPERDTYNGRLREAIRELKLGDFKAAQLWDALPRKTRPDKRNTLSTLLANFVASGFLARVEPGVYHLNEQ